MVLVVVGFVLLMLGVLGVGETPLDFVYYSIGACLLAAVFLIVGVIRGRPSKKPVAASGGDGKEASWSGASAWNDGIEAQPGDRSASTAVLDRDQPAGEDKPRVQVVAAQDLAGDESAPADETRTDDATAEDAGPDDGWAPEQVEREAAAQPREEPADATAADEDEVVVVPKASAVGRTGGGSHAVTAEDIARARAGATAPVRKSSARQATAKKATAKKATAKRATGTKATAKKVSAKKPAAASVGSEAQKFEDALAGVSGVGAAKRRQLAEHFGSYARLRSASTQELAQVQGISHTLATRIRSSLDARSD